MNIDENSLLNNSRLHILGAGKWINIFSIFAFIGIIFHACGGLALIYYSSTFPSDEPHYLDDWLAFGGIGLLLCAGAWIYPIILMRNIVRTIKAVKYDNNLDHIRHLFHVQHTLWRFMGVLLIVLLCMVFVCAVVLTFTFIPELFTKNF